MDTIQFSFSKINLTRSKKYNDTLTEIGEEEENEMAESLLAHLYTHIKGSQEDIATLSLQYILSQSDELNRAFNKLLSNSLKTNFDTSVHYLCQATGENKERPDLAGINNDGHEEILCEAKFYAGLTANQPLAYIDRLLNEEGKGLVFICPKDRIISLWSKLKTLCKDRSVEEIDEYCISVDGIHMTIVSWTEILNTLNKIAVTVAPKCLSDINQLEGYCSQMDSDAFIPFTEEDLGADIAIKGERYYQVVDQTIELLSADKNHKSSRKGLKARTNRDGYASSVIIDNIGITLLYDRYFGEVSHQWKHHFGLFLEIQNGIKLKKF